MIDAQAKLTEAIRHIIEDQHGLELVTTSDRPSRDGFPVSLMYAQRGTHTALTIKDRVVRRLGGARPVRPRRGRAGP